MYISCQYQAPEIAIKQVIENYLKRSTNFPLKVNIRNGEDLGPILLIWIIFNPSTG